MKKSKKPTNKFRTLITIPACLDQEYLFDFCSERGYTYLGMHWKWMRNGEKRAFWEFEVVEACYPTGKDGQVMWFREESITPPERRHR